MLPARSFRGQVPLVPLDWLPDGPVAYVDIETTGLYPRRHHVTVVGLLYGDGDSRSLEQYFVEQLADEAQILRRVALRMRDFVGVITYNGTYFDLPFLSMRAWRYGLVWPHLPHVDLYLKVKAQVLGEKALDLPDLRLATVLTRLGIANLDKTTGADMVATYRRWLTHGDPADRMRLLAHNAGDLVHLPDLVRFLTDSSRIKPSG